MMGEEPADGLDTARLADEDAVTLATIHRAKGLEWEAVFLPALYETNFPARPRAYGDPSRMDSSVPARLRIDPEFRANLDPALDDKARRDWLRRRHYDQEWRLAYVGITRARRRLYLSGAHWYGSPEPLKRPSKPGDLIDMARASEGVSTGQVGCGATTSTRQLAVLEPGARTRPGAGNHLGTFTPRDRLRSGLGRTESPPTRDRASLRSGCG